MNSKSEILGGMKNEDLINKKSLRIAHRTEKGTTGGYVNKRHRDLIPNENVNKIGTIDHIEINYYNT